MKGLLSMLRRWDGEAAGGAEANLVESRSCPAWFGGLSRKETERPTDRSNDRSIDRSRTDGVRSNLADLPSCWKWVGGALRTSNENLNG
jgi:hypothetical protein